MTRDIPKVARGVSYLDVSRNSVKGFLVANKKEVINPIRIMRVSRNVFYQRRYKYIRAIGLFIDCLKTPSP